MKTFHLPLLMALCLVLLGSCSGTPSHVIPPDEMASLLADMHAAEGVVTSQPAAWALDSSRRVLRQAVLQRHGVTEEQLDTSMMWYGRHIDRYLKVYDNTIKILEKRIAQAQKAGGTAPKLIEATVSSTADSANVWDAYPVRRLTQLQASDNLTFLLHNDRNWERGDIYRLTAHLRGARGMMEMNIAVTYADGLTEYRSQQFGGDGTHSLTLVLDSARAAQNVFGTLTYTPGRGEVTYMDSIAVVRTRNHDDNARRRQAEPPLSVRDY